MSNIRNIIESEVTRCGGITFARFMELALYCPNFGYYERPGGSPGRRGDYFTSVSVGALFGRLLARQFAKWLDSVPGGRWQILEAGAHDGQLARDVLRHLLAHHPSQLERTEYWILEPSTVRRAVQQKMLAEFPGRVRWFESWDAIPRTGITGIIFSNELLDAMPVHRLGWDASTRKWFEWGVASRDGKFVWSRLPEREPGVSVPDLPPELLEVLPDGFTTEVCPAAIEWWRRAAQTLSAGKLLTFDYGLTAEQFFTLERKNGTLRAYYRHHAAADILERAGQQDITASVNFSAIREAGVAAGLRTELFETQARLLTRIMAESAEDPAFKGWFLPREFQTLTHPEHLGESFRVLSQAK